MKFLAALLSAVFGTATASKGLPIIGGKTIKKKAVDVSSRSIQADSKIGKKLLANARRLENGDEEESAWVAGYSIKFQGCHHISQWNEDGNDEDEPKILTKRLVRFRLCPTDYCTYGDASGCDSGYGDYIIDMDIFLQSYWEYRQQYEEWNCEYYANNVCYCQNANNEEYCQYDCFMDNGLDYCVDENPYQNDDNNNNNNNDQEEFEVDQYLECGEWEIQNNNNGRRRKLDDGDDDVQFFIGPYCSDQGGKIHFGVFTDEYCTNTFVDEENGYYSDTDFYEDVVGKALPYSSESLVGMDCISCKEMPENDGNNNNNNNNDNQDADEVIEMCEEIYQQAGKCESNLADGVTYYPNENACTYIEGIKIVRQDGVVSQSGGTNSKTASVFLGILGVSFILLASYVCYLKSKLDRAKVNLNAR